MLWTRWAESASQTGRQGPDFEECLDADVQTVVRNDKIDRLEQVLWSGTSVMKGTYVYDRWDAVDIEEILAPEDARHPGRIESPCDRCHKR